MKLKKNLQQISDSCSTNLIFSIHFQPLKSIKTKTSKFQIFFVSFSLVLLILSLFLVFIYILLSKRTWNFVSTFLSWRQNVFGIEFKCCSDDYQDSDFYTNWPNWWDNQMNFGGFWAPLKWPRRASPA